MDSPSTFHRTLWVIAHIKQNEFLSANNILKSETITYLKINSTSLIESNYLEFGGQSIPT
jgi:hypothetical protein